MQPRRPGPARQRAWRYVLVTALLPLSLSACGGTEASKFTPKDTVLTEPQLKSALLTPKQLGRGFVARRPSRSQDAGDPGMGCLDAVSEQAEATTSAAEAEAEFEKRNPRGPFVSTSVSSFADTGTIEDFMRTVASDLSSCDEFKVTNAKGITIAAVVSTDNVPSTSTVDQQVNIRAIGTVTYSKKVKVPFGMWVSMTRLDNNAVFVSVMDFKGSSAPLLHKYTKRAVKRLTTVTKGDTPPDAKAEA